MSFSSLEVGHGTSAGAIDYPLRELERDAFERAVRAELDAFQNRHDVPFDPSPAEPSDEFVEWLRSDDSPLLLDNVEEFALDPEAHLRALAERVEGTTQATRPSSAELTGATTRQRAGELRTRLRTIADLNVERILATPRWRGTPKGETRTHYVWLVSPDRNISNRTFKRFILEIIRRRWPGAVVVGYIHRDTDNTHLHVWVSAETISGKKINVTRANASGDPVLDRYPDLDEEVARAVSRHFNDPSIYDDHIAKKLEWVHWRERFEESLKRGERLPVMPHRARHDHDWIGEKRNVAVREAGERRPHSSEREKIAPVPRAKSLMGALELWGKTVYLDARVSYRRELLGSLDTWRDGIDYPLEGVKQDLERKLAEAQHDYERHRDAFEKTLENRARKGYPELKYPLHNSKQIAGMMEIARLTRDAELLRHVRSYTEIDRPSDHEGQVLEISARWRDHVEARLEVLERAEMLVQIVGRHQGASLVMQQANTASDMKRPPFDWDREIVRGWLHGGWTTEQMRDSLPCFETEVVGLHAARHLKAREFFAVTGEALVEWREEGMQFAARPALEESHLDRLEILVSGEGSVIGERERALLLDLAASARSDREISLRETTRLLEEGIKVDAARGGEVNRMNGTRGDRETSRPHDDDWAGRLARLLILMETEALSLAVGGTSRERFEELREDVFAMRGLHELTRVVRTSSGMNVDAPAGAYDTAEVRALEGHFQVIANGLQSRGESWEEWQAAGVGEFKHILPEREQARAGRVVEEAKIRLKEERRAEAFEQLEPQLESAAQFYVRTAYRDEGLEGMREPSRLNDHVRGLAERFSQVARDAGHEPEHLGMDGRELEARAEHVLSVAVERFGRDEQEALELGRLEARMILACAVRNEAVTHQQRFVNHAHFHEWGYNTLDGRGSTSLCEIWLTYTEETDPAAILVAQDAEQHILRSINKVNTWLVEAVVPRTEEAEAATRAYEVRAGQLSRQGITTRGPVFEQGELARLEEAAIITRDHELIGLVVRCEQRLYGGEYAAARTMGRELRAAAIMHAEHELPEKFEHPLASRRIEQLPEQVRESVSLVLNQHWAAREAEQAAALSFHDGIESQARERAGEAPRTPRGAIRPLLTEVEAGEIYNRAMTMNRLERRSWDRMVMYAEAAVEGGKPLGANLPSLQEWARQQNTAAYRLGNEYKRGVGDAMVLSLREARGIIRQHAMETNRERPTSTRER